jgi:hypothetical protein
MVAMLCLARQERMVMGFVAYDCTNLTNRVDAYSLLEPAACPTREDHHEVERTIFGTGKMSVGSQEFKVTPGTTISYSTFLHGDLTDRNYCETGVLELPGGRKIGGQATQAIYEITVLEEYAKLNDLTGTITVASGISAKVGDLSLADPVEGTYVWTHQEEECPRTLVQLSFFSIIASGPSCFNLCFLFVSCP